MRGSIVLFLICFICNICIAQRDVLLIIADDIGTDYFSFYPGYQDTVSVPNIQRLFQKGIIFTHAVSNPVCSSTRTTILTGRYSFRTGVGAVVGGVGGSNEIDTSEFALPKLLNTFNPSIAKANIGKWHLNNPSPAYKLQYPLYLGYNHYEGPFIGQLPSYTNWVKYTNGVKDSITTYATTENVNNAISWKKSQGANPTFIWLAFNAPHEPLHLPPTDLHSYTGLSGTTAHINAQPKLYFKAIIQSLDHELGRLFDSLQAMGRLDSTDIIFIGDNGNTMRTAQITDLTKAKGTVYEYGVHIPFIISGPSVVRPGRYCNALVNSTDLFATIQELFGNYTWQSQIPSVKPVDSKSILPIVHDLADSIRPWAFTEIFKITPDSIDGKAIRNKEYKLIHFDYGKEEFYHIVSDSNESNNLLLGTLNDHEIENYQYLCTELSNLLGTSNYCSSVSINENTITNSFQIYPNPFQNKLEVHSSIPYTSFILTNNLGNIIAEGNQIQTYDLTAFPQGVYFLTIVNPSSKQTFKVIKQ